MASNALRALVVQAPFVQPNAPYPAAFYLDARLRALGVESTAIDHSIAAWRSLHSRSGLALAFDEARRRLDSGELVLPDEATRDQVLRYLSNRDAYLREIDKLVAFLSFADPSYAHRLAASRDLPYGARAEALLDGLDGELRAEDAARFATAILNDLGDFLSYAVDPDWGAVRYAERIGRSGGSFAELSRVADSGWILDRIYRPLADAEFERIALELSADETLLLLVTIPFPGCAAGALACARSARRALGSRVRVAFGGGYVSTELRELSDPGIFDDADWLVFDSGYAALDGILETIAGAPDAFLYRTMTRGEEGRILAHGFPPADPAALSHSDPTASAAARSAADARFAHERAVIAGTFPDWRGAPWTDYVGAVDSANPMHRLWSDAPWLKYHLAYGCYWARCAFCDTELEYVSRYLPSEVPRLMQAALAARATSGLSGIHFVDEALPLPQLLRFAAANAALETPFHFWGNVRYDKTWTDDAVSLLAAGGLVAVSGGIEIATERGLELTGKGVSFEDIVRSLLAFRRNGVLVHAYLIYGFPEQDERDIVDSMEAVRQLFAAGLVDSAFWHRFALTRHSRMYAEWKAGRRPALEPIDSAARLEPTPAASVFAANDLSFRGEERFERWGQGLDAALAAWMEGEALEEPLDAWFEEFPAPKPSLPPDFIDRLGRAAEAALDAEAIPENARAHWIAGLPLVEGSGSKGRANLAWTWRGRLERLRLTAPDAHALASAIRKLADVPDGLPWPALALDPVFGPRLAGLRGRGLVATRAY
ncbi:MAG: radical SAM protein [Spirochaetales bacterium]|nr:radical SAM protein [Spirochaetales bacterium]